MTAATSRPTPESVDPAMIGKIDPEMLNRTGDIMSVHTSLELKDIILTDDEVIAADAALLRATAEKIENALGFALTDRGREALRRALALIEETVA